MKFVTSVSSGVLLLFFIPSVCFALNPQDTFMEAVRKMRSARSVVPLVDYVDWDGYFQKLGPDACKALGFQGASDMRSFYKKKAEANGKDMLKTYEKGLKDERRRARQNKAARKVAKDGGSVKTTDMLAVVKKELARQQEEARQRIALTSYLVLSVAEKEDHVVVRFSKSYDGNVSEQSVVMRQSGQRWLFESASVINPMGPSGPSPVGALPEPTKVLFQP